MGNAGYHILVAEDTSVLAIMLKRTLEGAGFAVTVAKNGREAWERAQEVQFDVIVTDQQMPEMSGTELCAKLRQLDRYAETPVIMVTAKAYELDTEKMHADLNIHPVFTKPFSPKKVLQVVEERVSVSS